MNEIIKRAVQLILLGWFLLISIGIFYESYKLFASAEKPGNTVPSPPPPEVPKELKEVLALKPPTGELTTNQVSAFEKQINAYSQFVTEYSHQVTAYDKQVTAYGKQLEQEAKTGQIEAYKTVVNNSLLTMLDSFLKALIAYIFAKVGGNAIYNYLKMKCGSSPERLSIF